VEDYLIQIDASIPSLSVNDVTVIEGDSGTKLLQFTVSRSHNGSAVSVAYATHDGTAIAGTDYVAKSDTLSFAAGGALSQTVSVIINGDIAAEVDEEFSLILSSPTGATISDDTGIGTIENDDLAAITSVRAASIYWDPSFTAYVDPAKQLGYPIENGANQLLPLPWHEINRIFVQFTSDVTFVPGAVRLYGVNQLDHSLNIEGVTFNPTTFVATISFFTPLQIDKYLLRIRETVVDVNNAMLDGEWTTSTSVISGNGTAGGDFLYRFDIVPGDSGGDGGVTSLDISQTRQRRFLGVGDANYQSRVDFDGSAFISSPDISITRQRRFQFLPVGEPTVPPSATAVFVETPPATTSDPIVGRADVVDEVFAAMDGPDDEHETQLSRLRQHKTNAVKSTLRSR
ncbi:MAG: hypothetical protein KDB27_17155, partial [Planctomycetales bacterium]|nr:hypothetical protein [Planctomycetales bacterium]